jgi:tetratricopeptide (TPR) repeat protein
MAVGSGNILKDRRTSNVRALPQWFPHPAGVDASSNGDASPPRHSHITYGCFIGCVLAAVVFIACQEEAGFDQQVRNDPQKYFDFISLNYHQAAEVVEGKQKIELLEEALSYYRGLEERFPNETYWRAEARLASAHVLRLLARKDEALTTYASVVEDFPDYDFQILMAIKSQIALFVEQEDQIGADELCHDLQERFAKRKEQVFQTAIKNCGSTPGRDHL